MAGKHRLRRPSILARLRRLPAALRARWTVARHRPLAARQPRHETGATLRFAAVLHDLNQLPDPPVRDSGYYAALRAEVEVEAHERLMGVTELPALDVTAELPRLADSLPGA